MPCSGFCFLSNSMGKKAALRPSLSVTPESGPVGTEITVTGDGFARNGALTIKLGTVMIAISDGDISAHADGSFLTKFIINKRPYGKYNVTVQQTSGESVTENNAIEITPQITKIEINGDSDPTKKAYVGNTIKVYGNGWRRVAILQQHVVCYWSSRE